MTSVAHLFIDTEKNLASAPIGPSATRQSRRVRVPICSRDQLSAKPARPGKLGNPASLTLLQHLPLQHLPYHLPTLFNPNSKDTHLPSFRPFTFRYSSTLSLACRLPFLPLPIMSDSDEPIDLPDDGGDDLFGGDIDAPQSDHEQEQAADRDQEEEQERVLSDKELASDHEGGEGDMFDGDGDQDQEVIQQTVMDISMFRHRTPRTKDGFLQSLKVPSFLKFEALEYKPDSFEPTEWDKQNMQSENPKSVVRFKRHPETGELQSNTMIYKWSDGSMTMAVGTEHFEIQKKMMAPLPGKPYEEREDAHLYAAAPHIKSDLLRTVGHISEQYSVNMTRNMQDDARIKFANAMAAAARGKRPNAGEMIITATRDPELQKKEAELAEKERMKAQRRRENAAARLDSRTGGYRSGGLSIGDLEGGRRAGGGGRKRGAPGAPRAKRRRPEYDSDDDLPSGTRRGDEYDREDDFIAPSDEEGMSGVEDDEEEDILDDEEEERPRKKRQKTAESEEADADADLDDVDAPAAESSRARRRQIIEEDEDED
ncbi:Leo1-like protein-domain-containing protein [Xylariomycetidae sp. FL0641]|nr:Leo1-like protein-domain-containing protein [Xylariomycetidae sp. FL0641]